MRCEDCQHDFNQVARCGCGKTLCPGCVPWHACGKESSMQFTGAGDPPPEKKMHEPAELSNSLLKLRPYQEAAFASIVEALR